MKIIIKIKSNYGSEAIYPACEKSAIFAELIGQKTLTRRDLDKIKKLGYEIAVEQPATTL